MIELLLLYFDDYAPYVVGAFCFAALVFGVLLVVAITQLVRLRLRMRRLTREDMSSE